MRTLAAPLALSFVILSACGGDDDAADTALSVDTTLNRDLNLAGSDTGAQPQLEDVPASGTTRDRATTSPTRTGTSAGARTSTRTGGTTSRPRTGTTSSGNQVTRGGTGGGAVASIPAGTTIRLTSGEKVCTNTHKVGDRFTATVSSSVTANGVTIPAGATATVEVTNLKRSENVNDPVQVGLRVTSIRMEGRSYPITASIESADVERVRNQPRSKDVQKVAGGAAIGAIAGQVLGKDTRSTVIGAAAGAAAGTAAAAATANYEGCVNQGAAITIRLTEPATIRAE